MKVIITGNSGSGKSWLAKRIASPETKVIHLDNIFWKPGGFDQKRGRHEINNLISQSKEHKKWVAEGVFGELVKKYLGEATVFILLDIPWELCRERLISRGSESKRHMNRTQSSKSLTNLIDWAENYYTRTNLTSKIGHVQLFTSFAGTKIRLESEEETNNYLKTIHNKSFPTSPQSSIRITETHR